MEIAFRNSEYILYGLAVASWGIAILLLNIQGILRRKLGMGVFCGEGVILKQQVHF
jgi:hypothetical protein